MSVRRLLLTAAAMGLFALALARLAPADAELVHALAAPQHTVDTAGPDALVVAAVGLLAWVVWSWGALGLGLAAASALPGALGAAARSATHVVLPAGARRGVGVLLGVGLGIAAPTAGVALAAAPAAVAAGPAEGVPDWPTEALPAAAPAPAPAPAPTPSAGTAPGTASTPAAGTAPGTATVPDWPGDLPSAPAPGSHVVVRGDCLWHIAAARLADRTGVAPTDGETAREVHAWWTANVDVIGPDPDVLLPGQVLRPPDAP